MSIRAVVFDIGGVLEVSADGREPTEAWGEMVAGWESRLGLAPDVLSAALASMHDDGLLGLSSEAEWRENLRVAGGMTDAQLQGFARESWALYLGVLNEELASYLRALRPRYQTALLSNSFVGARREEEQAYAFEAMVDLIVYSHEEGVAKPDRPIYERTCERLEVSPTEVLFLDDVQAYVDAAREVGMHAVLFESNEQALEEITGILRRHA